MLLFTKPALNNSKIFLFRKFWDNIILCVFMILELVQQLFFLSITFYALLLLSMMFCLMYEGNLVFLGLEQSY